MLRFQRPRPSRSTTALVEDGSRRRRSTTTAAAGGSAQTQSSTTQQHDETTIYPPTIFLDETYSHGILVPNPTTTTNDNASSQQDGALEVTIQLPTDYYAHDSNNNNSDNTNNRSSSHAPTNNNNTRRVPALSNNEAMRWCNNYAAQAAARRREPMNTVRLLGVITLFFEEKTGKKKSSSKGSLFSQSKKYSDRIQNRQLRRIPAKKHTTLTRAVSKNQALSEAILEFGLDEDVDVDSLDVNVTQTQLESRANEIFEYWKVIKNQKPLEECWNIKHGGFVRESVLANEEEESEEGEECFVPIICLLNWLKSDSIVDMQAGRTKELYNGLCHIATDAQRILESLVDLSCPQSLYKIPLVTPYAIASRCIVQQGSISKTTWKVRIGVYMNRLLPEVLTAKNLHCVMSALDDDSFIVSEPLHVPALRDGGDPVFKSSKYPIVRMPRASDMDVIDVDAVDTDYDEEEKKMDDDDMMIQDPTVMGSTRETKTISPFTPQGYLKLLESTGNDISMFPQIARSLAPYLKLDLMLHQRHALCWMTQMEQLGGFGINSIIFEERTFLDGGKYYYSPALGQIRLNRPPKTVGGCVADEMGLGKTLEMLSLIASSLAELKREARGGGDEYTHTTLIIVPPALVAQWVKEVEKSCGTTVSVKVLDANANTRDEIAKDLVSSRGRGTDILITTYSALEKPKTSQFLANWRWGRIVLDEQQEIRSSTTKIAKNCEALVCHRRWMLSGTPLFEGVKDLRGELNFLRLVPYAAKWEDGFFDFSIMNHWNMQSDHGLETLRILGLLILRRSKDMTICRTGASIMAQKRLTVELVPVAQSDSERALYCWFESIVSQEVTRKDSEQSETKKSLQSKSLCLRLLREICFSACLINGGLGVASQMKTLNTLYRKILAREEQLHQISEGHKKKRTETIRTLSPLAALRFLSQADRAANVREDFVSDVRLGRGQGAASRARAVDDIETQVKEAQASVDEASKKESVARKTRAVKNWHLALELITTGALCEDDELVSRVKPSIARLWRWRSIYIGMEEASSDGIISTTPCLFRGWRPRPSFAKDLLASNPNFRWAFPGCLQLSNIPVEVTLDEVKCAIFEASKKEPRVRSKIESLRKKLEKTKDGSSDKAKVESDIADADIALTQAVASDIKLQQPNVIQITTPNSDKWEAYVQIHDDGVDELMRNANSKTGFSVKSAAAIPHIQAALEKTQERFSQAEAEYKVHPSTNHKNAYVEAEKALVKAKLGLRMMFDQTPLASTSNVVISRAMGGVRGVAPRSKAAMIDGVHGAIAQATDSLSRALASIREGQSALARLLPALNRGVPQDIAQKSAYEILESIRNHKFDETQCSICLGPFGQQAGNDPAKEDKIVAMVSCGHMFCIDCLDQHAHQAITNLRPLKCPNCRSGFSLSDVIHINHLENDDEEEDERRNEAKAKVIEASHILSTSEGLLDAEMWSALFLSIDVPAHVNNAPHHTHTALRRDVLAHFRAACGMEIDSSRNAKPNINRDANAGLSTKIQSLLCDLPLGEHAVVFASSKESVLHLATVIKSKDIECFSLFTGQATKETEQAVSIWESTQVASSKVGPVLIVQAGAAASGLTLTAASKVFLMEPFQRQEEEAQAYARCHRYGQTRDVHVKVYYSPVTVEQRLLRWRRRAVEKLAAAEPGGTNYVFSPLFEEGESEDGSDTDDADEMFVESVEDGDNDEDDEEDDRKMSANGGDDEDSAKVAEEDNLRTQFLLGLVDEDGNPIATAN